MPYKVKSFAGDDLPDFIGRGDNQSLGTQRATEDMVRLPGGTYYDNFGNNPSPRELASITKQSEIHAAPGSSVREQIEAWRARLGEVGELAVEWHDGALRWVNARFVGIRHPREFYTSTYLPIEFYFMPRDPVFYGETAEVAVTSWVAATFADTVTVTNDGTVNATAILIELLTQASGVITLTLENYETSQRLDLDVGVAAGDRVVIDTDRRTIRTHEPAQALDSIGRSGNVISVETGAAHGLTVGDGVEVAGTDYDGFYTVVTTPGADTLTLAADSNTRHPHGPQAATGTIAKVNDAYSEADSVWSDPAGWLWLVPGANAIHITSDADLDDGSITFTFYPTYG